MWPRTEREMARACIDVFVYVCLRLFANAYFIGCIRPARTRNCTDVCFCLGPGELGLGWAMGWSSFVAWKLSDSEQCKGC